MTKSVFTGKVYVVRDNIDTDQIIPAQYLTLVPTIPAEYEKLGSYALIGLPDSLYPTRYIEEVVTDDRGRYLIPAVAVIAVITAIQSRPSARSAAAKLASIRGPCAVSKK